MCYGSHGRLGNRYREQELRPAGPSSHSIADTVTVAPASGEAMASRPHATMDEQVLEVKELVQRTLEKQGLLDHVRVSRRLTIERRVAMSRKLLGVA